MRRRTKTNTRAALSARIFCLLLAAGVAGYYYIGASAEQTISQEQTFAPAVTEQSASLIPADCAPSAASASNASTSTAPAAPAPAGATSRSASATSATASPGEPRVVDSRVEQLVAHEGYRLSYNPEWRVANWVAYFLTPDRVAGNVPRASHFVPDPQVGHFSATNDDYRNSGYDRGHMAPAGDMKWSAVAMKESFYFSNVCPQNPNLNRGDWQELEQQVRRWATRCDTLFVVCGPLVSELGNTIGEHEVAVPTAFYKVLLRKQGTQLSALGFLFANRAGSRPLAEYAVSVDRIEAAAGIDFFPRLPDTVQQRLEASVEFASWK